MKENELSSNDSFTGGSKNVLIENENSTYDAILVGHIPSPFPFSFLFLNFR
jgi:hypothetical protein